MGFFFERSEFLPPKFPIGRLLITFNAYNQVGLQDVLLSLRRHMSGDWGAVDEHDKQVNETALKTGGRLFSVYQSRHGIPFWIITEADRSVTTILLPEEY